MTFFRPRPQNLFKPCIEAHSPLHRRVDITKRARDLIRRTMERLQTLVSLDIWAVDVGATGSAKGRGLRFLRFCWVVWHGVRRDQLPLQASALTFSTLMSLAPLLVLGFSVLKGLGFGSGLPEKLLEFSDQMPAQFSGFVEDILAIVENTSPARLGGIGGALLLIMVVQMLGRIEGSFNRVWGVRRSRSILQQATHYISMVVVVPILFAAAIAVSARIQLSGMIFERLGLLRLTPLLATILALFFLYFYMPNTRVKWWAAMLAGLIGGLAWQAWFRFYIIVQPGVTNMNVLYGTLAAVPIFLAWVYISWVIILMGAEIANAVQNTDEFEAERRGDDLSFLAHLGLTLDVLMWCAQALQHHRPLFTMERFRAAHPVSRRQLNAALTFLSDQGWLGETVEGEIVLLRAPETLPIDEIIECALNPPSAREHSLSPFYPSTRNLLEQLRRHQTRGFREQTLKQIMEPVNPVS